jgi:hypothetical protein
LFRAFVVGAQILKIQACGSFRGVNFETCKLWNLETLKLVCKNPPQMGILERN